MNAPFKQTERLGRLTTELGKDALVLLRFEGSDYLNDLFEYRVEALATRDDLDFDALIGTHATVEIEAHDVMPPSTASSPRRNIRAWARTAISMP